MSRLCQTFQSPYSQPSQASKYLSVSHLSSSVSLWSNIQKHLLFSGFSCAETLLLQQLLIPTPFYLKSISSLLISATLLYLSIIPSCMLLLAQKNQQPRNGSYCFRGKLYCYSSPSHLTPENFVSPSAFCLFFFFNFRFLAY